MGKVKLVPQALDALLLAEDPKVRNIWQILLLVQQQRCLSFVQPDPKAHQVQTPPEGG
jgi:hypothetical protein